MQEAQGVARSVFSGGVTEVKVGYEVYDEVKK